MYPLLESHLRKKCDPYKNDASDFNKGATKMGSYNLPTSFHSDLICCKWIKAQIGFYAEHFKVGSGLKL